MKTQILFEDNDILVVRKPSGIAVQSAKPSQPDIYSELLSYVKANGTSNPFIGIVHRLDQPVEGILVFAKNKSSAADLNYQITNSLTEKYYYALCLYDDPNVPAKGTMVDYLIKDGKNNTSKVVPDNTPGAKKAVLEYKILRADSEKKTALVQIRLITGRHHQIRVQFASCGLPLIGDEKYGNELSRNISTTWKADNTSLCAYKLCFAHPKTHKPMEFKTLPTHNTAWDYFESDMDN